MAEDRKIIDELVIYADNLDSTIVNNIKLPVNITYYRYVVVLSVSIPKSWYNLDADSNVLQINGVQYLIPAGIYNVFTLISAIYTAASITMTFNNSTLRYTFNATISTTGHDIAALLGIPNDGLDYTASSKPVNFNQDNIIHLNSTLCSNNAQNLVDIYSGDVNFGTYVKFNCYDELAARKTLIHTDSDTFPVVLLRKNYSEKINLNGLTYSVQLKFLR